MRPLSHFAWLPWLAAAVGAALLIGTSCAGRAPDDGDEGEGEAGEGEGEAGEGEGEAGEGEGEGGEGEGEGGLPPPPLECPAPDDPVPGDTSLQGTPFADMVITWDRTLTLCAAWTEGAPIENELAKKVRVVIPPQFRPSFGAQDFSSASLEGVTVERGVDVDERVRASVCHGQGVADGWTIDDVNPDFPVLRASMRWDFGDAGAIVEMVSVGVQTGQAVPPVVYGDSGAVSFGWEGDGQSAFLDDCADASGAPTVEPYYAAMEIIVAARTDEDDNVQSLSLLRSLDTFDTFAGSYPFQWKSTVVARSDEPFVYSKAFDYWPHTYAAQHHNWEETSRIDFDRDLANYHAYFSDTPVQQQGRALKTVQLQNVDIFAPDPSIVTTDVDLATDVEITNSWSVQRVVRVDATSLERALLFTYCEDGEVKAVGLPGYDSFVMQLLLCPRDAAPGYEVSALVPVAMGADMSVLGVTFDEPVESVVEGAASWRFELTPALIVDIRPFDDPSFEAGTVLIDIDAPGDFDSSSLQLPTRMDAVQPEPNESLVFASDDGNVAIGIVRHRVGQGVGESSIYAPVSTTLMATDSVTGVPLIHVFTDGYDAQHYVNTHHNWDDALDATARHESGDVEIHWSVAVDFEGEEFLIYTVSATQNGVELIAPTRVRPSFTE